MDRRHFIRLAALSAASGLIPIGRQAWALAPDGSANTQRKMIVILLRGAVDGLNVVVPYSDAEYYRQRPTIAIPRPGTQGGAIDLDGQFGMHPALAGLRPLWEQRKLAFVHASGSPDSTRSHFDAQDYIESGTPGVKNTPDGWMNRLLSSLPGKASPTRAVSIGPLLPRILSGSATVTNLALGASGKPTLLDRPKVGDAFAQLYRGNDKLSQAYREAQSAHQEIMTSMSDDMQREMQRASGGAPLPNGLPGEAAKLAAVLRKDPNIQLAFLSLGGWDTHINQGASDGQLANRLLPLGQGLATLAEHLGPLFDDTVIVVMSEFGRTAHENGNRGTDHGHGNAMWLMGGPVAGGKVYADWQGLGEAHLHEGRDLPVTTDFRSVLAQIAERHLGLDDARMDALFPGMPARAPSFQTIKG